MYFEALDLIINGLNIIVLISLAIRYIVGWRVSLLKWQISWTIEEVLDFVKFYKRDLSKHQLKVQLDILAAYLSAMTERYDLHSLLSQLKAMSQAQRSMLGQVCTATYLILVVPDTNAASERSFRTL